jgi:hypothetical protein
MFVVASELIVRQHHQATGLTIVELTAGQADLILPKSLVHSALSCL